MAEETNKEDVDVDKVIKAYAEGVTQLIKLISLLAAKVAVIDECVKDHLLK